MSDKKYIKDKLNEALQQVSVKGKAAGVLLKCVTTGNVLLLLRNDPQPTWALISGGVEEGEEVLDGLKREIVEETKINPNEIKFEFNRIEDMPGKDKEFYYYEGFCRNEFTPTLDHENLDYKWCNLDNLPTPLYNGIIHKIKKILQ